MHDRQGRLASRSGLSICHCDIHGEGRDADAYLEGFVKPSHALEQMKTSHAHIGSQRIADHI